jgi:predicted small integral membrane protein
MLSWMVWTTPVAVFFGCIVVMLISMTIWEMRAPSVLRKGFLPIATTRGDRLFIGLMCAAWVNLAWVGLGEKVTAWLSLSEEPSVWISFGVSMLVLALIMRKG